MREPREPGRNSGLISFSPPCLRKRPLCDDDDDGIGICSIVIRSSGMGSFEGASTNSRARSDMTDPERLFARLVGRLR